MSHNDDLRKALSEPMPYKWKVQDNFGRCVAYVDSRDVQNRLDDVCGIYGWQCNFKEVRGELFASVGIYNPENKEWVWKEDCGVESKFEKAKGAASDAFKRASVKFGVGRFLYDLPMQKVTMKEHNGRKYPVKENGEFMWNSEELTEYIENRRTNNTQATESLNLRIDNEDNHPKASSKYQEVTEEPEYDNPDGPSWSDEVKDKAAKFEANGKKGSQALMDFIDAYNEKHKGTYTSISDFNTDKKLLSLINFALKQPPEEMVN